MFPAAADTSGPRACAIRIKNGNLLLLVIRTFEVWFNERPFAGGMVEMGYHFAGDHRWGVLSFTSLPVSVGRRKGWYVCFTRQELEALSGVAESSIMFCPVS